MKSVSAPTSTPKTASIPTIGIRTGKFVRDGLVPAAISADALYLLVSRHPISDRAINIVLEAPVEFFLGAEAYARDHWALHFLSPSFDDAFYYVNLSGIESGAGVAGARRMILTCSFEQPLVSAMRISLIVDGKRWATVQVDLSELNKRELAYRVPDALAASREGATNRVRTFELVQPDVSSDSFSNALNEFVYISGTQKSGTTWLENILNADPRVLVLHEGNLLSFIDPSRVGEDCVARSSRLGYVSWYPAHVSEELVQELIRASVARRLLEHYGSLWKGKVVGDRTPGITAYLNSALRTFTSGKVLHIVRHPLDVAVSWIFHDLNFFRNEGSCLLGKEIAQRLNELLEKGKSENSPQIDVDIIEKGALNWIVDRWVKDQETALQLKSDYPDRVYILFYECLLSDPKNQICKLFEFVGLTLDERQLDTVLDHSDFRKYSGGRQRGQKDSGSFYRSGTAGDHRNYFTQAAREAIFHQLEDTAYKCCYSLEHDHPVFRAD